MTELWPTLLRPERRRGRWQLLLPRPFHTLLLTDGQAHGSRLPWLALGLAWLLALLALLGPSWQRMEQAATANGAPLVAILDLTPRMLAADVPPSRLEQARRTLTDLLEARRGAQTGIVVYAGSTHVLVPLSDDLATTLNLLGALKPSIMPEPGQRADLAVARAQALLEQANQGSGRLLLLTSGLNHEEQSAISHLLEDDVRLDVLGIGTAQGAPLVLEDGSFLKDEEGAIVLPRLDAASHERFARQLGGTYQPLRPDTDLRAFGLREAALDERETGQSLTLAHWVDQGYWLLLPLLLLAACAGRRGWLFCLPLLFMPVPGHAFDTLWLRADQQAQRLMIEGHPEEAAQHFTDPQRQGYALYLAGKYAEAAERFARGDQAADHYNRGNALAQDGQLDAALHAFDLALERDPQLEQARHNRERVAELLRQQQAEREQQPNQEQPAQETPSSEPPRGAAATGDPAQSSAAEPTEAQSATADSAPEAPASTGSLGEGKDSDPAAPSDQQAPLDRERRQALEQWLRQIPDDPAELLRRKFRLEQQQRQETP